MSNEHNRQIKQSSNNVRRMPSTWDSLSVTLKFSHVHLLNSTQPNQPMDGTNPQPTLCRGRML